MHSLYFVRLPKDVINSPTEAVNEAVSFLDDNNFTGGVGMWGGGKSDWYEVGGRWSGLFTELQDWYKDFTKQVRVLAKTSYKDMEDILNVHHYGSKKQQGRLIKFRKEVMKLFKELKPEDYEGVLPLARHGTFSWNAETGEDYDLGNSLNRERSGTDDAFLMTKDMWKRVVSYLGYDKPKKKKKDDFWGTVEVCDTETYDEFSMRDLKEKEAVGSWFVVIDYHF